MIRSLPSFVVLEAHITQGSKIKPTIDLATDNGCCVMMNKYRAVLERDIATIRELESSQTMFEMYENDEPVVVASEEEDRGWEKKRQQLLLRPCSLEFVPPSDTPKSTKTIVPAGVVPGGTEL